MKRKAEDTTEDPSKKPKKATITSFFGAPKPVPGAQKANASAVNSKAAKFDKEKWVESLTKEQKELLQLEIDTLHESWLPYLADDLTHSSFLELKRFLKAQAQSGMQQLPKHQL